MAPHLVSDNCILLSVPLNNDPFHQSQENSVKQRFFKFFPALHETLDRMVQLTKVGDGPFCSETFVRDLKCCP